jgi:Homeodomain-like domain
MARTVSLLLSAQHSADLQGVIADRGRPVKPVQRAQIILLSAERLPVLEIAKRVGVSRPMVWRWQQRFAEEGIEGLLRDKTRPPGIPPVPQAKVHAVVERTLREPPGAVTHWTGRAMAKAMGLSLRTIQRIWDAHKLQPHRIKTFKRSNDPDFAAKLDDVVGLYMNPPRHAVVVSIDEKSQIQALDRTQPDLPLKRGNAQPSRTIANATARRPCSPRSACSKARPSAAACRAIGIRSSSASSQPSSGPCQPAR